MSESTIAPTETWLNFSGVWHHFIAMMGKSGIDLYVDGKLDGQNQQTGTLDSGQGG